MRSVVVSLLIVITAATAQGAVRGGIEIVPLPAGTTSAEYDGRPVLVVSEPERVALVGIPLDAKLGTHHLQTADGRKLAFEVSDKAYPEQRLTIANPKMVNPPKADLERIARETKLMRAQYERFSAISVAPFPLTRPADGPVSSTFGLKRVLNGEPRSPHAGLDIAAPHGDPVISPADGVVSLTGEFYFNGNTVFVDHGGGVITMACHMSEIAVQEGARVARGALLGKVGATGRVTGPHLHWSLIMNGARIDPEQALSLFAPAKPAATP